MSESTRNFSARQVVIGDRFLWCGRQVEVLAVMPEKRVYQRRGGISGRLFKVELPDGEQRVLHYFDDERVLVLGPQVSG